MKQFKPILIKALLISLFSTVFITGVICIDKVTKNQIIHQKKKKKFFY